MKQTEWMLCPVCGSETRNKIREDTVLVNYPLHCPKCRQETFSVNSYAKEPTSETPYET